MSSVCCVIRLMVIISKKHEQGEVKIVDGAVVVQMLHPKNSKNISGVHSNSFRAIHTSPVTVKSEN